MKYLFYLLFCCIACAPQVTVHDETFCAIGPDHLGAACDNLYSSNQVILTWPEWDAMNTGWLCMSPQAYGDIKIELSQFCSVVHCNYEQIRQLNAAFSRIENLKRNWR